MTSCRHTGGVRDGSAEHKHRTPPCQTPVGNNKRAHNQHLNGSHCELPTANADPDAVAGGHRSDHASKEFLKARVSAVVVEDDGEQDIVQTSTKKSPLIM